MRLFILCVAATLVAAVAPQILSPKLFLPPNPTSANHFTVAEYAWSETMAWGFRAVNSVRKMTTPTAFHDFWSNIPFTQIQNITTSYSIITSMDSTSGLKKLHKEVLESNKTVKVPTVTGNPELIELESEELFTRSLEKFAECMTILKKTYTLSENLVQKNEKWSQQEINEIDEKLKLAFSKLSDFDEHTKVAFQKWRATLWAYRTSMSPDVMFFEQTLNDKKIKRVTAYQRIFNTNV